MKAIGQITPQAPYNFAATCDLIARFPYPTTDVVHPTDDGQTAFWRILRVDDVRVLVRVTAGAAGKLDVMQMAASGTVDPQKAVAAVGHILCADLDMAPFYEFARTHSALWAVVEPLVGVRWLRSETAYEALMTIIIEQQITWKTAQRAQRWLVEWAGHRLTHNGRDYYAFPTPNQVAAATVDDLKPLKITFKRMNLMISLSQQIENGEFDVEGLRDLPEQAAYDVLIAIKGIGHWTATETLQRLHGVQTNVPYNDVALQAAVNRYFYGAEGRIPAAQVTETFAPYGQFAGLASHHTMLRWIVDQY